jgi:homoserine kinase type II
VRNTAIETELPLLVEAFGLGEVRSVTFIAEGLMNRNWRIEAGAGVFALKQIIDVPVAKARRSLDLLTVLAARGLPVCAPRPSGHGEPVVEVGDHSYCLVGWAQGGHRQGVELEVDEAAELGVLLGRFHHGLAETPLLPTPAQSPRAKVTAPEAAVAEADRFLALIGALETGEPFDLATLQALEQRKVLLAEHAAHRPANEVPRGPFGWTHGDVQPLNILWHEGMVAAVLDWDRLGVRPYAEEVARTAQVQFTTAEGRWDLERVAKFAAGYRSVLPLGVDELADAVERLRWKRMTDFWQLQWHYDKHDHGADELWVSGELLLDWWTGHQEEVQGAFAAAR